MHGPLKVVSGAYRIPVFDVPATGNHDGVLVSANLYGILMELCQKWLTTTRTMDVFDALANAAGAFACALLACAWSCHRKGSNRANDAGH